VSRASGDCAAELGIELACQLHFTLQHLQLSGAKGSAAKEDAEQLAECPDLLWGRLLIHMLSIKEDLILAVQDLYWRIIDAQPEEVILKVFHLQFR
jgi:hypothetical protein